MGLQEDDSELIIIWGGILGVRDMTSTSKQLVISSIRRSGANSIVKQSLSTRSKVWTEVWTEAIHMRRARKAELANITWDPA